MFRAAGEQNFQSCRRAECSELPVSKTVKNDADKFRNISFHRYFYLQQCAGLRYRELLDLI